ncbi:MAG: MerR family transcriptional regulator [Nitrospiraceae bacterium]|nr:MAG: MerR family transcriptional regulator [Nitrospiraceae bacterium]
MKKKLAYTIHEASVITGVPPHTIRFWEKDFHEYLRPAKTSGGQRRYCAGDMDVIRRIKDLRYREKYTVAGTLKELKSNDEKRGMLREGKSSRKTSGALKQRGRTTQQFQGAGRIL